MQKPPITLDPFRYMYIRQFFKDDSLASFDSLKLPELLFSSQFRLHETLPSDEIEGVSRALIRGKQVILDTTLAFRSSPRMVIIDRKGRSERRRSLP